MPVFFRFLTRLSLSCETTVPGGDGKQFFFLASIPVFAERCAAVLDGARISSNNSYENTETATVFLIYDVVPPEYVQEFSTFCPLSRS